MTTAAHTHSTAVLCALDLHQPRKPDLKPTDPEYASELRRLNAPRISIKADSWPTKVLAFRTLYTRPTHQSLTLLDDTAIASHKRIIEEEYNELWAAVGAGDHLEILDGGLDLIYTVLGLLVHMGYSPAQLDAAMEEIHAANLTKADGDGNPIISPDGKVLKGPHTMKPNLLAALCSAPPGEANLDAILDEPS